MMAGNNGNGKQHAKSAAKRPFIPSLQAGQVLLDLAVTQYLTIGQLRTLPGYSKNLRFVQRRMSRLTQEGYCLRLFMQPKQPKGTAPTLYALAERGRRYAEDHGYPIPTRYRPTDEEHRSPVYLDHVAAISDVYVALKQWEATESTIRLEAFHHERFLHALPKLTVNGRTRSVKPDAAVLLRETTAAGTWLHPLTVEVDLGTERQTKWREKIAGLLVFANAPSYRELYTSDGVRVGVIARGDEARAATLCRWTETLLAERHAEGAGGWFRFTGRDPATAAVDELWTGATWKQPFTAEPRPLLDLEVRDG